MSRRAATATAIALVALAAGGCGQGSPRASGAATSPARATAFPTPTRIDNRWLPLRPGIRYVLRGRARDDSGRLVPHVVVLTVTDLTKTIDGVPTVVVWDRDYYSGRLTEAELAFFAQDRAGNVWTYGEYPEEYAKSGKLEGAPSTWIPGVARARAGVSMKGSPGAGTPSYLQGFAPAIDFADRAKVVARRGRTCVPAGCYREVLVTEEWSPRDNGAHQLKYYAAGVGNIRAGFKGHDRDAETLVLVGRTRLSAAESARVRAAALQQDRRGYRVSPRVYAHTPPARPTR